MGRLEGQVALITGAAGGLGQALSLGFAREGARLFLSDLDSPKLEQLLKQLRSQGLDVFGFPADLRQPKEVFSMVERALSRCGRLDTLINNAAVSSFKPIWDLTDCDWDAVLGVNVKGLFFSLQAAARYMVSSGSGSIINIASVAGRAGRPMLLHYAASKAAVISITRSAALALAKQGVRVNAIAPGMIETEMLQKLRSDSDKMPNGTDPLPQSPSSNSIPLGRVAQPEDIVATAVYLASRDSEYVTGQTLNVCGGLVMS